MNLTTLLSRSSSSILTHLSRRAVEHDAVLLFALSLNATNLEAIISRLSRLASQTVGCLSSHPPGAPESVICSIATIPARDCILFRSEIPGRPQIQVGKTTHHREVPDKSFELPDFSSKGENFWESRTHPNLPPALLGHERQIKSLLFFSDNAPEGILKSLTAIPEATKLGLIASSTPFITGRPFSLFHNNDIYSSGAVGVALRNSSPRRFSISFPGILPMSKPVKVSRSESNLIHELDHSNPSKMLVEAITAGPARKSPIKGEDFFLGLFKSVSSGSQPEISRIYRILSGDPSRGSIALDAENAPQKNEMVQFFRRDPMGHPKTLNPWNQGSNNHLWRFVCSSEDISAESPIHGDEVHSLQNTFFAESDNGFLCTDSEASIPLWKCNIPGAVGNLEWL